MKRNVLAAVLAVLVIAGAVWAQRRFVDRSRVTDRIFHVSIPIEGENCAGYDGGFFHTGGFQAPTNPVGYLTGQQLERFEVDHVVALAEAWCSRCPRPVVRYRPGEPAGCRPGSEPWERQP